jgi:hypothetical protein
MLRRRIFLAILVLVGFALASAPSSAQPRVGGPGFRVLNPQPIQSSFNHNHLRFNLSQSVAIFPGSGLGAMFSPYPGFYSPFGMAGYGYPGAGYSGYGYPAGYPDPYSGYLKGSADVINAQGQYLKDVQEAYLLAEQVKAKQLDNRRKAYEEFLWEQGKTPPLNEQREQQQRDEARRSLTDPPQTEIWSGKSLNDLLVHLQDSRGKGMDGPNVAIPADVLRNINVAPSKGPASVGLLKQITKLNWPVTLRTLPPVNETRPIQFQIDGLLTEARRQALARGRVDPGVIRELERNVEAMMGHLRNNVSDLTFNQYVEARQFLKQLDDAVKVLQLPDAGDYLNGKYTPRGDTVKELLTYLSENGLRFAGASGGEESAYTALHRLMVQYQQGMAGKQAGK